MTQLDREQSADPEQCVKQSTEPEEGVLEYRGQILEQTRFVEDTVNKFAVQNYAASGGCIARLFCREQ